MELLTKKPRVFVAIAVGMTCVLIILAAVLGYLGGKSAAEGSSTGGTTGETSSKTTGPCTVSPGELDGPADQYYQRWYPKYVDDVCVPQPSDCNSIGLPRHYVAYHLNGKTILIDGQGNDQAWTEAPWSETFIEIHCVKWEAYRLHLRPGDPSLPSIRYLCGGAHHHSTTGTNKPGIPSDSRVSYSHAGFSAHTTGQICVV